MVGLFQADRSEQEELRLHEGGPVPGRHRHKEEVSCLQVRRMLSELHNVDFKGTVSRDYLTLVFSSNISP